jgi:hypothetical protein
MEYGIEYRIECEVEMGRGEILRETDGKDGKLTGNRREIDGKSTGTKPPEQGEWNL